MVSNFLSPAAAAGSSRQRVQNAAAEMQKAVEERAQRTGVPVPPYQFLEMIGKGSFGQVFKCKKLDTAQLVAIKIIDVDSSDYHLSPSHREEAINDFTREIAVLQQLKDARAKNINVIYEALPLHSQLWLVSEYCGGGSVHTLMKASPPGSGLEEKFIIPIAREVAVAIHYVHEAGIIHRDLKCGNIFITEDGRVQVGDFGVSGVLEDRYAKRTTIIGTPNWMPPEMLTAGPGFSYGTEIDIWAFGCTVYEMATGRPPMVPTVVSKLMEDFCNRDRAEGKPHSDLLKEFLAFCLQENPRDRPTADGILHHPFIAGTSRRYPTTSLIQLLERYLLWEQQGGQRHSLLNPMFGASGPEILPNVDDEDWNFSTTDRFSQSIQFNLDQPDMLGEEDSDLSRGNRLQRPPRQKYMSPMQKARKEAAIARGEKSMLRVFDPNADPYEYSEESRPMSDLPFRNMAGTEAEQAGNRTTMIDLDAADIGGIEAPNIDLTLKSHRPSNFNYSDDDDDYDETPSVDYQTSNGPKRATLDWKFPMATATKEKNRRTMEWSFQEAQQSLYERDENDEEDEDSDVLPTIKFTGENQLYPGSRSAPDSPRMSMINLDLADVGPQTLRPSTAGSATHSLQEDNSAVDPFELERQVQKTAARKTDSFYESKRASHRPTQSAPTQMVPPQAIAEKEALYNGEQNGDNNEINDISNDENIDHDRLLRYREHRRNQSLVRDFLDKSVDGVHLSSRNGSISTLPDTTYDPSLRFGDGSGDGSGSVLWSEFDDYDAAIDLSLGKPGARFPVQFPQCQAPAPESLEYKVDVDILKAEMRTQIGNFALALDAARAALMSYRNEGEVRNVINTAAGGGVEYENSSVAMGAPSEKGEMNKESREV